MNTHHNSNAGNTLVEMPTTPDSRNQNIERDDHGSGQGSASALAKMKLIDRRNAQLRCGTEQGFSGVIVPSTRDRRDGAGTTCVPAQYRL